jgi:predicted amidohydrolase
MRVAAVQMNSTADFERNLERADRFTRAAAADGAQLVVLPEKWSALGRGEALRAGAQPLDGPAIAWARATARELGIDLVAGSISERELGRPEPALLRNTSVHVGPDGEIHATYRKVHMFDVVVEGTVYRESEHEEPGEELVLSETAGGVELGLSICYDVRFPELYRILALEGAELVTVPAHFTTPTGKDHWHVLLRARAIENQYYVAAPAQVGETLPGKPAYGRSLIVDPWGIVLAQAPDEETVISAELDRARLRSVREKLPSLKNRQADAYSWPAPA